MCLTSKQKTNKKFNLTEVTNEKEMANVSRCDGLK